MAPRPNAGSAPGLVCHCYKPSPPMPTYLVAWVVGELEHVGSSCKTAAGQTPVAVWATEDRCARARERPAPALCVGNWHRQL